MKKIVVIQPMGVSEKHLAELRDLGNVTYHDTVCKDGDDWANRVNDADIVMSNVSGLMDGWPQAKNMYLSLTFVGYGFFDIQKLKENNVLVSNSPGCNKVAVSEWIIAMLLNHQRYLFESMKMVDDADSVRVGRSIYGKKICIIGKGNIGSRTGTILKTLGADVDFYTRNDSLQEKLQNADIIIDCLSANPSTQNFYSREFFSYVKQDVIFISISPNETQDLELIERKLEAGEIGHFITDNAASLLYETAHPDYVRMKQNPNITITPHMAAYADNTVETANRICIDNIKAYLDGHPRNLIYEL